MSGNLPSQKTNKTSGLSDSCAEAQIILQDVPCTARATGLGVRNVGPLTYYLLTGLGPYEPLPTAFAEDHSGNVWIGFYGGQVLR